MAPQNPTSTERLWLAATMVGATRPPIAESEEQAQALLACAIEEGVVALVHQRLTDDPTVSAALVDLFAKAARESAVPALLRESECRRILPVLLDAGIPVLLLKGSALAWWLYPASYLRECIDIDLLFPSRRQVEEAARLLAMHGYALAHSPDDAYELLCRREVGRVRVDLDMHWRLLNSPQFADTFDFQTLHMASITLPRLAAQARGLGAIHAFMHACVHRAVNLHVGFGDRLKWLYDLHLLAQTLTPSDWSSLQLQCGDRELSGICLAGVDAAAELFGDAAPNDALQALRAASSNETLDASRIQDWKYMQGRNLAALPSLSARAQWIRQRIFPPMSYLRELYGSDRSLVSLWVTRAQRAVRRFLS